MSTLGKTMVGPFSGLSIFRDSVGRTGMSPVPVRDLTSIAGLLPLFRNRMGILAFSPATGSYLPICHSKPGAIRISKDGFSASLSLFRSGPSFSLGLLEVTLSGLRQLVDLSRQLCAKFS